VLMPMTGDGAMLTTGIESALRGVYVAQMRADDPEQEGILGSTRLGFQVVLANTGRAGDQWPAPVQQLTALAGTDHPVVAVTGLGSSLTSTQEAAVQLSKSQVPSVGAVLTGTWITGTDKTDDVPGTDATKPTLFHVGPSNHQYIAALQQWVEFRKPATGYLVRDTTSDPYLDSLYDAFTKAFGAPFGLDTRYHEFRGSRAPGDAADNLFLTAARDIRCSEDADVVFYSGRSRDLDKLVRALTEVTGCSIDKHVTIAAGTTGLEDVDTDPALVEAMRQKNVSVIHAASTDYRGWGAGHNTPPGYHTFLDYYRNVLSIPEDTLADGYAIMHHDAVITVVWAARYLFEISKGDMAGIRAANIKNEIVNIGSDHPVPAASGPLYFGDITRSGGRPHAKPVPLIEVPAGADSATLPTYTTP